MDLGVSGLASGFDWKTLVEQLTDVERAPQKRLLTEQNQIQQRKNAYSSIETQLNVLQNRLTKLKDPAFFDSRIATSSDAAVGTATVASATALGSYSFNIQQRATAASWVGASNAGKGLSAANDVSGLTLASAKLSSAIKAGTFTVNGKQITVATSDTFQEVFDGISAATSGAVTAAYDASTDKITFSSSSAIVLGSATDTSNFLQAAKLTNNSTGTVTSSASLGAVQSSATLSSANLDMTISDGGSGAGQFKINGVSIAFNASSDSVAAVLKRINDSAAGVTASYDSINDRFTLTNKSTGDVGIALEDVAGNFLAATGLSSGSLVSGKNLLYTVNDGGQISSRSNVLDEESSGLSGLTLNVLKEGTTTVSVSADTVKIKSVISDFLTEYSKAQTLIDSQTASTTDSKGKVTAGILAGESDGSAIATRLRSLAFGEVSGLSGVFNSLSDIGIQSNGNDNTLKIENTDLLDASVANNLSSLQELFTDSTNGLAVKLSSYVERTVGDDGTLIAREKTLSKQSNDIDTQVADLERLVQANKEKLTASFIAMESAQARSNQQLKFLQERFK